MTSPYAGPSPFVVDPDFNIWVPALHPVLLEGRDLTLEQWAATIAASSWAEGVTPDPDDLERVRRLLMLVGSQDFPSTVPWQDKWIHYPDRSDMPLAVMISDNSVQDDGSDDELRAYLRVGDPLLIEEPIVEEVHTALGRGPARACLQPPARAGQGQHLRHPLLRLAARDRRRPLHRAALHDGRPHPGPEGRRRHLRPGHDPSTPRR